MTSEKPHSKKGSHVYGPDLIGWIWVEPSGSHRKGNDSKAYTPTDVISVRWGNLSALY